MKLGAVVVLAASTAACEWGEPVTPPLPPLLQGARTTGGSNSLCEGGERPGSTPETASHSPEVVQRLRRHFPPGTSAARLREELERQGFEVHEGCSPDGSIGWAQFRQSGGNGITVMAGHGTVYWKEDQAGRIVWATGDVGYTSI